MSSIPAIISYLEFGRSELLKSVEGLSWRERTQLPVYSGWTIKDILAHMIGWDEWVINILPLIIQNRADEVAGINVDEYNRATVETWRDKSLAEVQTALQATHHQIIEMISVLNHVQIDMRRERQGRIITIRNYIIEMMEIVIVKGGAMSPGLADFIDGLNKLLDAGFDFRVAGKLHRGSNRKFQSRFINPHR